MRKNRTSFLAALLLAGAAAAADDIGDALDASLGAQRAARESQQRVNKLFEETRALHDKRRAAEWQSLQLAAYAEQLEQEAAVEENKRAGIEAELKRVATTGTELAPLTQRMLAELETFIASDLPFLHEVRQQRIAELKTLLADPQRGNAEKFRRVLEAWRSEAEYGYSLGAEDVTTDCEGKAGASTLVRVGRIGLYCLSADGKQAAYWDAQAKHWTAMDDGDDVEQVALAVSIARAKAQPELLVLPVKAK